MSVRSAFAIGACAGAVIASAASPALATCFDRVKDGTETDVDCGGACPPCERRDACRMARDCMSGRCAEFVCEERAYELGAPTPAGYRVEMSNADGAATARTVGVVSLGLGYGVAYVFALSLPGNLSWLYAPVVGPWVEVADRHQGSRGLIAVDGLLQTVGAALVIGGIATGGHQLIRDDGPVAMVRVSPAVVGAGGYGVGLLGLF